MVKSTRSSKRITESLAIIEGLSSDGGLYIFEKFPTLNLSSLLHLSYQELSSYILNLLLEDFTKEEIEEVVHHAYDEKFDTKNIVAFHLLKDVFVLELFHGPTLAFKDMALTILPELLRVAKKKNHIHQDTLVLTATSGDTGGATLSGFKDIEGMKVIVFYPNEGVSLIQERQMLSFASKDAKVIAIEGNFDDAQRLVKEEFQKYPKLSSSNSINIGRLAPQVIYYVDSYLEAVRTKKIHMGEYINICVPTGNFGNILAGYIAKKMGVPIHRFICASNQNKVLTDFFLTGVYNRKREFYKTNSPSMDILISSNLERLLYLLFGENKTKEWMESLVKTGEYHLNSKEKEALHSFYGGFATIEETLDCMKKVYDEEHYLLDPHTAVAYQVYQNYVKETKDTTMTLLVSTAHPFKFPQAVCEALQIEEEDSFEALKKIHQKTKINIPTVFSSYTKSKKTIWKKEETKDQFDQLMKEFGYDQN